MTRKDDLSEIINGLTEDELNTLCDQMEDDEEHPFDRNDVESIAAALDENSTKHWSADALIELLVPRGDYSNAEAKADRFVPSYVPYCAVDDDRKNTLRLGYNTYNIYDAEERAKAMAEGLKAEKADELFDSAIVYGVMQTADEGKTYPVLETHTLDLD